MYFKLKCNSHVKFYILKPTKNRWVFDYKKKLHGSHESKGAIMTMPPLLALPPFPEGSAGRALPRINYMY